MVGSRVYKFFMMPLASILVLLVMAPTYLLCCLSLNLDRGIYPGSRVCCLVKKLLYFCGGLLCLYYTYTIFRDCALVLVRLYGDVE